MRKTTKYFNERISLKENHCTYDNSTTDLAWEISIDGHLVGSIWKLYDEDFYKLVLTSFGAQTNKPKYQSIFGKITDGENKFKSKVKIINLLISNIKENKLKKVRIHDSFRDSPKHRVLITNLDFDKNIKKFKMGDKISHEDKIYEVIGVAALLTEFKTKVRRDVIAFKVKQF